MIVELREHIEETLAIPVHFVQITESEEFPCASIRKIHLESHQGLNHANGFRVTGVELTLWGLDYVANQATFETLANIYDGRMIQLGESMCKFVLDDVDDDAHINPDGSDDWVYATQVTFRVHYKIAA